VIIQHATIPEPALKSLVASYRSHLAVTNEGELVYEFDPSFERRDRVPLGERLRAAGQTAWRGFTFFFHEPGKAFGSDGGRDRQLLVGASPHDEIADTHWYRPDFDHALLREAEAEGAVYLDQTRLERFRDTGKQALNRFFHAGEQLGFVQSREGRGQKAPGFLRARDVSIEQ
jgi:hypothetical protein